MSLRAIVIRLFKCERGIAFVEFGLFVGILLLLYLGSIEVSRYVLLFQKLTGAANQESNIITTINPRNPPSQAEMDATMSAVSLMMTPFNFNFNTDDMLIITDIYDPPPVPPSIRPLPPVVMWRYCSRGVPSSGLTESRLGAVGTQAIMSEFPGFSMAPGDEIIVAEGFFNFVPFVVNNAYLRGMIYTVGNKHPMYVNSITVPRFGSLINLVTPGTGATIKSNCP